MKCLTILAIGLSAIAPATALADDYYGCTYKGKYVVSHTGQTSREFARSAIFEASSEAAAREVAYRYFTRQNGSLHVKDASLTCIKMD